jgi:hypothetical protein
MPGSSSTALLRRPIPSESNAVFNAWLKSQGAHQGLRDFEAVDALARQAGLVLLEDRAMPSNNRCLVWQRAHSPL